MKNKFCDAGFTLVELLLVVTILGILAAIAIPRLFPQTEKARVAEAVGILSAIRQGEEAYFLENSVYLNCDIANTGNCWENLGMENPNLDSKYFNFDVINSTVDAFDARAERNGGQFPGTIILDEAGIYTCSTPSGQAYSFCPSN